MSSLHTSSEDFHSIRWLAEIGGSGVIHQGIFRRSDFRMIPPLRTSDGLHSAVFHTSKPNEACKWLTHTFPLMIPHHRDSLRILN
jgi:hypothetical protein